MKRKTTIVVTLALSAAGLAYAQSGGMKGMDMKGMDMQKGQEMMGGRGMSHQGKEADATTHQADGTVKAIDTGKSKITLAHGPVKSLNWPGMTMAFSVKDKSLLDKVKVGQKVHVQFMKQGADYVVTSLQ